jgi:hypothetical protein
MTELRLNLLNDNETTSYLFSHLVRCEPWDDVTPARAEPRFTLDLATFSVLRWHHLSRRGFRCNLVTSNCQSIVVKFLLVHSVMLSSLCMLLKIDFNKTSSVVHGRLPPLHDVAVSPGGGGV